LQLRLERKLNRASSKEWETSTVSRRIAYSTFRSTTGVPVHLWEPKGRRAERCVVIVSMPLRLPTSMQMACWNNLAEAVVGDFACKVFLVTSGAHFLPSGGLHLRDFLEDLLVLIDSLPWKEPFVLVDNTMGAATSILWPLRKRLASALVVNSAALFSEDFLNSVAQQKFTETFSEREKALKRGHCDGEPKLFLDSDVAEALYAGPPQLLASMRKDWEVAAFAAGDEFWRQSAAHYHWAMREQAEALAELPALDLEVTLACSEHCPAVFCAESTRRLLNLLPKANFTQIEQSNLWWEVENSDFVIRELVALLHLLTPYDI